MGVHTITLSHTNWTGISSIFYDDVSQTFYEDEGLVTVVDSIEKPIRELYRYNGFYAVNNATSPGAQYIDEDGNITDVLRTKCAALSGTNGLSIYVNGTQVSYKLTLSVNGGTSGIGTGALYRSVDGGGEWHTDYLLEGEAVHSVEKPVYDAKIYNGHFNGASTAGTQYIDADGNFTNALESLVLTGAKTIYAWWASPCKVTVSANSGSGGTTAFYYDPIHGKWAESTDFLTPVERLDMHTRECYALLGYMASNSDTGIVRVYSDGTIATDWTPTASVTVYARWSLRSYKATINKGGGVGGSNALFYKVGTSPKEWFSDYLCNDHITALPSAPTRSGYSMKGVYSSASGGTKYIGKNGDFLPALESLSITANKTFYAQWSSVYKMTISHEGGTGDADSFYYDSTEGAYYDTETLQNVITSVTPPTRECFSFNGYWSDKSGGTRYIDANGAFLDEIYSLAPTSAKTLYAQWSRVSYRISLDGNGGDVDVDKFYNNGTTATFYADDRCTNAVSSVPVPSRTGYTFIGYYATKTGGSRYIDGNGNILSSSGIANDITLYARWSAKEYTITFDYNGGVGSVQTQQVTYGQPIGILPVPSSPSSELSFGYWMLDGVHVDDATIWEFDRNATLVVRWHSFLGNVEDYFRLGSSSLIPISSSSGDRLSRVCAINANKKNGAQVDAGRYSSGVNDIGGVLRNPTVTYMVVGDTTLKTKLGKAFPATLTGYGTSRRMTVSGWMITRVQVDTGIGQFPKVVVSGVANEGVDAINLFDVSIPVSGRARAQAILGAVDGGGYLQNCTATAECTPVVCVENLMPCASDVVGGRITVSANMVAPNEEAAPTAKNGFTYVGRPMSNEKDSYLSWEINVEKEIV